MADDSASSKGVSRGDASQNTKSSSKAAESSNKSPSTGARGPTGPGGEKAMTGSDKSNSGWGDNTTSKNKADSSNKAPASTGPRGPTGPQGQTSVTGSRGATVSGFGDNTTSGRQAEAGRGLPDAGPRGPLGNDGTLSNPGRQALQTVAPGKGDIVQLTTAENQRVAQALQDAYTEGEALLQDKYSRRPEGVYGDRNWSGNRVLSETGNLLKTTVADTDADQKYQDRVSQVAFDAGESGPVPRTLAGSPVPANVGPPRGGYKAPAPTTTAQLKGDMSGPSTLYGATANLPSSPMVSYDADAMRDSIFSAEDNYITRNMVSQSLGDANPPSYRVSGPPTRGPMPRPASRITEIDIPMPSAGIPDYYDGSDSRNPMQDEGVVAPSQYDPAKTRAGANLRRAIDIGARFIPGGSAINKLFGISDIAERDVNDYYGMNPAQREAWRARREAESLRRHNYGGGSDGRNNAYIPPQPNGALQTAIGGWGSSPGIPRPPGTPGAPITPTQPGTSPAAPALTAPKRLPNPVNYATYGQGSEWDFYQ